MICNLLASYWRKKIDEAPKSTDRIPCRRAEALMLLAACE